LIGEVLGSYRVTHELGSGGMGVVYAAEHIVLGSRAAVKMLLPRHSRDEELVRRFFNEARAATLIKHPGIVAVFDYGHHASGSAYLVMELLEGETLAGRRDRLGRLPERQVLALMRQVAGALAAAHDAGIIHRDLKPHNLFVVRDPDMPTGERMKVLDFGIAKLAGPATSSDCEKTHEGSLLGTPKYMAPEQCRGAGRVDARADIYSFGCILFELACGTPPFDGEASGDLIAKQIYELPPRPSSKLAAIDRGFEALILRCLQKDPNARPASMVEVARVIDELVRPASEAAAAEPAPPAPRTGAPPPGGTMTATRKPGPGAAEIEPPVAQHIVPRTHRLSSSTGIQVIDPSRVPSRVDPHPRRTRRRRVAAGIVALAVVAAAAMLRWWLGT